MAKEMKKSRPQGKETLPDSIGSFNSVKITLADKNEIIAWSHGEVTKPETINYRTQKPERDGLFDEKIFGPVKNYECACGKYKSIRYKGVICDRCGVEVTHSSVRRRRMGHIELAVPCAHIWYVHGVPSRMALILDITSSDLERVIYFGGFIIKELDTNLRDQVLKQLEEEYKNYSKDLDVKMKQAKKEERKAIEEKVIQVEKAFTRGRDELLALAEKTVISEDEYYALSTKYGQIAKVGIGAAAILDLLQNIDLEKEINNLEKMLSKYPEGARPKREMYRLRLLRQMKKAGITPESMVLEQLPVIPPDLRPLVQLDGGRFAASDLNDLYRRIISRNNRLNRLIKEGAPEVILRNEKRMLQEAVDALLDNSARGSKAAMTTSGRRALRSLADMLRGKQGRFRQNLLGKRVDYSGRSVIVVGPELKLNQCGIPKIMALEMFKPFVIAKLLDREIANNIKHANQLIDHEISEVWEILAEIIKNYFVLLNRAPTLHRLGIQAFKPVLVEGKAIRIHPLVCEAYNADFDGDQMAVFLPLSKKAQLEAEKLMYSVVNLLKPASGKPISTPVREMVWGIYYLTFLDDEDAKPKYFFGSEDEVLTSFYSRKIDLQDKIKVKLNSGEIIETSCGRVIFNQILPEELKFVNVLIDKKGISRLINKAFNVLGKERTVALIDDIKDLGYSYATQFGSTISMEDIIIPTNKGEILAMGEKQLQNVEKEYNKGMITKDERHSIIVDIWSKARGELEKSVLESYSPRNPVYSMVVSGSRGSMSQLSQLSGMKGLVVSPSGQIIDLPVKANYREGLDVLEYFISSHGARKGRSDTALRTAEAGYLTRRLVDVAQDVVILEKDCGTKKGIIIKAEEENNFAFSIRGRVLVKDVKKGNSAIAKSGELITFDLSEKIAENVQEVEVFSPLTCEAKTGACQKCYGEDLARGELVMPGTAVGIVAAQAIGEPGTQLTLRTFHIGGVVGADITQGLPRVQQIVEARSPKVPAILAEEDGKVRIVEKDEVVEIVLEAQRVKHRTLHLPKGVKPIVKKGDLVKEKDVISEGKIKVKAPFLGTIIEVKPGEVIIESKEPARYINEVSPITEILVADGDKVKKGEQLTGGNIDPKTLARLNGEEIAQRYMINEINNIYVSQGQEIHPKHFEVVIARMFAKGLVLHPGGSHFIEGQVMDRLTLDEANAKLKEAKKKEIIYQSLILGITQASLSTDSFLSAASFQETSGILRDAALIGKTDKLKGIKENVIIGKLIPASIDADKQE
ncbi:MAG: DNA-directed RNA polymerase subunit beta' [Patescibacteria group bacterium]|nr:DNA-directed RNA polymerase subunit beta' [Patescibacteria group bacterium]